MRVITMNIKKIHQIWLGKKPIPKDCLIYMNKIREMYSDYGYKLWRDEDISGNSIVHDVKHTIYKADILRMEILYNEGGLYLDCDVEPNVKLPDDYMVGIPLFSFIYSKNSTGICVIGSDTIRAQSLAFYFKMLNIDALSKQVKPTPIFNTGDKFCFNIWENTKITIDNNLTTDKVDGVSNGYFTHHNIKSWCNINNDRRGGIV
jgi:mannosyltransferase OCH1-like enzyme